MDARFLFPHRLKIYGVVLAIPFLVLSFFCLFYEFQFEFLTLKVPDFLHFDFNINVNNVSDIIVKDSPNFLNLTNDLALLGTTASLLLIAFSKHHKEDEYISKIRLESLQWALYVNYGLLLIATLVIHGFTFLFVPFLNIFTPLIIFIFRFHFLVYSDK